MNKIKNLMKKITKKQKITSAVIVAVALVVGIGGYFIYQQVNKPAAVATLDMSVLYQDEIVEVSDIIVGLSESTSAILIYEEIALDSAYVVSEILVEMSSYVEEGDIIAILDLDSTVLDEGDDYVEIEEAEDVLTQLTIETETKLIEAKATYDKSVTNGENASTTYNLTIDEIDDTIEDYEESIEELEDEISELEDQIDNGLDSDYGLADATDSLEEVEESIDTLEDSITSKTTGISNATDEFELEILNAELAELNAELEELEKQQEAYENAIDTANDDYDIAYAQVEASYTQAVKELSSTETAYQKYLITAETQKIEAKAEYDSTISTYSNAYTVYTMAVEELEDALAEAEELVEELQEAIDEEDDEDENIIIDEDGYLYAPCTGYVTSVVEPTSTTINGTTISTGLTITMSDNAYAQLELSVSEDDIADIYLGMPVNVYFDAYEGVVIEAEVTALSLTPSSEISTTVNYTVTVLCDIPDDMTVFSSMSADVTFIQQQITDALVVSINYIVYEDAATYVYLEQEDGTVVKTEIETGFSDGFDVEILSGLEEGDIILNESAVTSFEN